jgi:hypothetical protein
MGFTQHAGRMALEASSASDSTVATHTSRFGDFKEFAKENGVARMERVTSELVREYGQQLADKVDSGEMKPAYAQNLVSSVNSTMSAATRGEWKSVSPTKDCGIQQRSHVRGTPTMGRENAVRGVQALLAQGLERQAAVAQLAKDLGLRSKEGSLLNAKAALAQAETRGTVSISDGTKGGREREIQITNDRQVESLRNAATAQGDARAVMPADQNWKQWRENGLREGREALQAASGGGYHELRSQYACERYEAITGHSAPCNGGQITDRQVDAEARQKISVELGHGRSQVTASYVGGRS